MIDATYVCVDWGTTSFRLWALDQNGGVLAEKRSGHGMSTLKPADYEAVLEAVLTELKVPKHTPVVICGMAGAAQGWKEAYYVNLPTCLKNVPSLALRVPTTDRDVRILPGLANRNPQYPDVMRGEETLLLGAVLEKEMFGVVCLPGTHSKWVWIENGTVTRFSTAMTGEVFSLLANNSTLSHFITSTQNVLADTPAFTDAVKEALAAPQCILNALFSVRATPLLMGSATIDDMAARLSGLLIGLEISGMKTDEINQITLISDGFLGQNYLCALQIAKLKVTVLSADELGVLGLYHAAKQLWPERSIKKEN